MRKLRRLLSVALTIILVLSACSNTNNEAIISKNSGTTESNDKTEAMSPADLDKSAGNSTDTTSFEGESIENNENDNLIPEFYGINDPSLHQYVEDSVCADIEDYFASDDYIVEDIHAVYISQDYLNELAYNSKTNIYFGYTLEEIEEQFNGTKYIFTLGDDGTTVVQPFEGYDDTFDQVVKNVAIGGGVILICVTLSVASGGLGMEAVSLFFAASAKTATSFALSSTVFSSVTTATIVGYQTNDMDTAFKEALLSGSEGFMWGAIVGAITGGVEELLVLKSVGKPIPSYTEAETEALLKYGGDEQITFLAGEIVPYGTKGATRPDIVRTVGNHIEAIEVKNYDLVNNSSLLYRELERQVAERVENLPAGSTQRIVLNVEGRGYKKEFVDTIVKEIQELLFDIYPNIPVDIMGAVL